MSVLPGRQIVGRLLFHQTEVAARRFTLCLQMAQV